MYETPGGSWRSSRLGRQRRARKPRKPQLRSKPATDRRPAPRPWNNNKNKTNKQTKAMQLQTSSSPSSSVKQYPPMYQEVLSWLCVLQGRRLLAHTRDILWWAKVSILYILAPFGVYHRNFPGVTSEVSTWASSPFVFNLICGIS